MSESVDEYRRAVEGGMRDVTLSFTLDTVCADQAGNVQTHGKLTVEYEPRQWVLTSEGEDKILDRVSSIEYPEKVVVAAYQQVVDSIYPGYQSRDKPWETAPMLVSYDFRYPESMQDGTVTLGSML